MNEVKQLRERHQLTQQELADRLRVNIRTVQRWEASMKLRAKIITAVMAVLATSNALAFGMGRSCSSQRIGSQVFTTCSDGTSEHQQDIGKMRFYNGSNFNTGESWSGNSMELGSQRFRQDYGDYHRSPSLNNPFQQPQRDRDTNNPYRLPSLFD